jgi:hypothetical protein
MLLSADVVAVAGFKPEAKKEGEHLTPALSMNPGSKFKALKYWRPLILNCLTPTLTPGRGNSFSRIGV